MKYQKKKKRNNRIFSSFQTNEISKNRIFFFFFSFFCELLYSRKNARTIRIFEHSIHSGNSFGWDVMVAQGRGEKPVQHEQWEYQNYRGAPARTTNDPLILWTAHTERWIFTEATAVKTRWEIGRCDRTKATRAIINASYDHFHKIVSTYFLSRFTLNSRVKGKPRATFNRLFVVHFIKSWN